MVVTIVIISNKTMKREEKYTCLTHEVIPDGFDPGCHLPRIGVTHGHAVVAPFVLRSWHSVVENEIRRADGGRGGRRWRLFLLHIHLLYPVVPVTNSEHVRHRQRPSCWKYFRKFFSSRVEIWKLPFL